MAHIPLWLFHVYFFLLIRRKGKFPPSSLSAFYSTFLTGFSCSISSCCFPFLLPPVLLSTVHSCMLFLCLVSSCCFPFLLPPHLHSTFLYAFSCLLFYCCFSFSSFLLICILHSFMLFHNYFIPAAFI
jgi:hypothetical protein